MPSIGARHTLPDPVALVDEDGVPTWPGPVAEEYPDREQTHLLLFSSRPTTEDPTLTTSYSDELEVDGAQSVTLFMTITATGAGDPKAGTMTIVLQGSPNGATFFDTETALPVMNPATDKTATIGYYMVAKAFCAKAVRLKCIDVTTATLTNASIYWRP